MDLFQSSGNMETPITSPSDSTAGAGPCWLLLNSNNYNDHSDSSSAAKQTTAASCTSTGLPFTVSFTVAAPPALSSIHGHWVDRSAGTSSSSTDDDEEYYSDDDEEEEYYSEDDAMDTDPNNNKDSKSKQPFLQIIAAHDGAVLIAIHVPAGCDSNSAATTATVEHFLYDTSRRSPPSLSLLPDCYVTMDDHPTPRTSVARYLGGSGILRRDDGEVLVAQLEVGYAPRPPPYTTAELCVLCPDGHGNREWVLRRVPIVHHEANKGKVVWSWAEIDAVVPVGTRFMCWVDYLSGVLVCDMAAVTTANEEPNSNKLRLRYVPLPLEARCYGEYNDDGSDHRRHRPLMHYCRNLAAASSGSGDAVIRLVSVAPRCCCGGPGRTTCERSSSAFNVTTWTMRLSAAEEETMAWVKDGVLDCDELWRQPRYGCVVPRVALKYPVVCSDDPDVVCFAVYDCEVDKRTVWMVEINTRSNALLGVARRDVGSICDIGDVLPAKFHWK